MVTTSLEPSGSDSKIVPLQLDSVVAGISPLFHNVSRMVWFVLKGLCRPENYLEMS